ncbi:hypothetical protein GALMADRAFT_138171 [Galerina marginata CBS 339.88]|uniref:DUF8191 domain-containing protein n=1 Tax=Galerina marginata (strain CBS 339.88) TaxID=685588 RepID=A0A067TGC8_GALM3|nr:hypothetical protein GALMADRAFT_138171 [Galerina marginata CBS 339.88]
MSTSSLETEIQLHKSSLKHKDVEIKRLKRALQAFLVQDGTKTDQDGSSGASEDEMVGAEGQQEDGREQEESDAEQEGGGHESLPAPFELDEYYGSYFCTECIGEVVEGNYAQISSYDYAFQVPASTETQAIHPDRSLVPRGDTPLREIPVSAQGPPTQYRGASRPEEYSELLRRGATRMMCETFNLEYTYEGGIYAWADTDLFEEFSGSLMRPEDQWKIHLGRRISLDEDDIDGSAFIEGLLEDAQVFSFRSVELAFQIHGNINGDLETNHRLEADGYTTHMIKDKALEGTMPAETVIRPNDYSLSDDDREQVKLERDDPGYFTTAHEDAVWKSNIHEEDLLMDDPEPQASELDSNHESDDADMDDSDSNSDDAGSDFDSDEVLSGDEIVLSGVSTIRYRTLLDEE